MSRTSTESFVRCCLAENPGVDPKTAGQLQAEFANPPFALAIFLGRLKAADPKLVYSESIILFLASLCDTPARVVLWAHHVVTSTRRMPVGAALTMTDLAHDFPDGFPTEAGYGRIWDAQKGLGGNRLDMVDAWRTA